MQGVLTAAGIAVLFFVALIVVWRSTRSKADPGAALSGMGKVMEETSRPPAEIPIEDASTEDQPTEDQPTEDQPTEEILPTDPG